jgi:predicted DNA-binding ribbon-helix-helix protein
VIAERESTSLRIDRNLYKEFKREAKRRDVEISRLLDYAM